VQSVGFDDIVAFHAELEYIIRDGQDTFKRILKTLDVEVL